MKAGTQARELITLRMEASSLTRIEGDNRGSVIVCLNGSCWITQEGDLEDHFIDSAECFTIDQRGLVIVQALQETEIFLTPVARVCSWNPT